MRDFIELDNFVYHLNIYCKYENVFFIIFLKLLLSKNLILFVSFIFVPKNLFKVRFYFTSNTQKRKNQKIEQLFN